MRLSLKRTSFYLLAAVVGAGTFGLVWLPNALAVTMYCNPSGPAVMCYQGSTVSNVPPYLQAAYLANGGTCGKCGKPPTSPVGGPP
jgi:hypothetical protein